MPTSIGRTWRLLPGKFTAYGLKVSAQADSEDLRQMNPSSSSLRTSTVLKDIKVERTDVDITPGLSMLTI